MGVPAFGFWGEVSADKVFVGKTAVGTGVVGKTAVVTAAVGTVAVGVDPILKPPVVDVAVTSGSAGGDILIVIGPKVVPKVSVPSDLTLSHIDTEQVRTITNLVMPILGITMIPSFVNI